MKKRIVILVAVMVALLLVVGPVAAKATVTEFTGTETFHAMVDPGTETNPGGNIHIRGLVAIDREDSTDLRWTGFANVYANANLDANGVGRWWGTWDMTPDEPFEGGSWEGIFTGMVHADGSRSYRCVGHGSGDFEGLKVFITIEYPPGEDGQVTGRILDPHGE